MRSSKRPRTGEAAGEPGDCARPPPVPVALQLPTEVLVLVLQHLQPDAVSVLRFSLVCRSFRRAASPVLREARGLALRPPRRVGQALAYAALRLPLLAKLDIAGTSVSEAALLSVARGCASLNSISLSDCRHLKAGALEAFLRLRGGTLRSLGVARLRLGFVPLLDVMAEGARLPLPLEELDASGASGLLLRAPIGGSSPARDLAPRLRRLSLVAPPASGPGSEWNVPFSVPLAALAGLPLESLHAGPLSAGHELPHDLPAFLRPPPALPSPAASLRRLSLLRGREDALDGAALEALVEGAGAPLLEALRLAFVRPEPSALAALARLPAAAPRLRALSLELSACAGEWLAVAAGAMAAPAMRYAVALGVVPHAPPEGDPHLAALRARFGAVRYAASRYPHERGLVCGDSAARDSAGARLAWPEAGTRLAADCLSLDELAWRGPGPSPS